MKNKLFKNGLMLLLARITSMISSALVGIFIARSYSIMEYGLYSTALAVGTFIFTFTDIGFDVYLLKEASKKIERLSEYFGNILLVKLIILFITSIFLLIFSLKIGYEPSIIKLIIILLPFMIVTYINNSFFVVFQVTNKLTINAFIQFIYSFFLLLNSFLAYMYSINIFEYSLLQSLASIIVLLIYIMCARKIIDITFSLKYTKKIISGSYMFGISSLLYVIYYKVDTVMLSIFINSDAVAVYESAYKIITIIMSLTVVLDNIFMPIFFRLYKESEEVMGRFYQKVLRYILIIAFPISIGIIFISDSVIEVLYTTKYKECIPILAVLSLTITIRLFAVLSGFILTATDNMNYKVKVQFKVSIFNIILNLILIPSIGVIGACFSTILTELIIMIAYFNFTKLFFNFKIEIYYLWKIVLLNIIFIIFLFVLKFHAFNWFMIIILGVIFYFFTSIIFFKYEYIELKNILIKKV